MAENQDSTEKSYITVNGITKQVMAVKSVYALNGNLSLTVVATLATLPIIAK